MEKTVQIPPKAKPLFDKRRYTVLYGGRGSGKSHSVARALLIMAYQNPLRVLCCREIQRSIRDSVHRLLSDCIEDMGLQSQFQIMETEIRGANGSLFLFSGLSTQTIESIKSLEGVDMVWVEEAQTISERSWQLLIPTIRKPGSRFILTMNPMLESDPTSQRFLVNPPPECLSVRMNWNDNPFLPKELDDERRHHQDKYPETYGHVWEGNHLPAVEGAIYFNEMQAAHEDGRLCNVPADPLLVTHTVWDLGLADSTAILMVQTVASEIRIVDYIEDNNKPMSEYVALLSKKNYRWGDDFIPHDGWHRQLNSGKSVADLLSDLGRSPVRVPDATLEGGIKVVRDTFPRVYIDKTKCAGLIESLKRYRWNTPQNGAEARRPFHDAASHAADAFRYVCVSVPMMGNAYALDVDKTRRGNWRI